MEYSYSEALDISGINHFLSGLDLQLQQQTIPLQVVYLYSLLINIMRAKITSTLFFLLFLGILCCGDLLLLQQRGKQAFHIIPPHIYIKPALYSFQRASLRLLSLLQFSSQDFITCRIVLFLPPQADCFLCVCGTITDIIQTGSQVLKSLNCTMSNSKSYSRFP